MLNTSYQYICWCFQLLIRLVILIWFGYGARESRVTTCTSAVRARRLSLTLCKIECAPICIGAPQRQQRQPFVYSHLLLALCRLNITTTKMTTSRYPASESKRFFLNRKFYFHISRNDNLAKSSDLIKIFGGQIETFLDNEINYVLTDLPKEYWPPNANQKDDVLEKAHNQSIKIMSVRDLVIWCQRYISSQSSSDEDDDPNHIRLLQPPYIKHEDSNCHYTPCVREFAQWPEVNLSGNIPLGKSIFSDSTPISTPIHSTNNQQQQHGVRRRHSIYCEICSTKTDKIEEHCSTEEHKQNTDKFNWATVVGIIQSLPSLSTLNMRRLTNISVPKGNEEFLCLHKVDTVSQLFVKQSTNC